MANALAYYATALNSPGKSLVGAPKIFFARSSERNVRSHFLTSVLEKKKFFKNSVLSRDLPLARVKLDPG